MQMLRLGVIHVCVCVLVWCAEDAIKAAVKDIKAKRGQGSSSEADSSGHKAEATA